MAKTLRDAKLETRTARARLAASSKPYYRSIDPGLHLGYRKGKTGGKWVLRWYKGGQDYFVETIGTADDSADADGESVLSFAQAQARARSRALDLTYGAAGIERKKGPYAVANALEDYLKWMDQHRKSARDSRTRAAAHILPALGTFEVARLTTTVLREWLQTLSHSPARIRSRLGSVQQYKKAEGEDVERRRKSTANRTLTILKAALNLAWHDGKVESDSAWRRVKPFEGVDGARVRYLSVADSIRLINACEPDFRDLVQGALMTGARYSELAAFKVEDFHGDSGTIHVRKSKSGKARSIVLTEEGVELFERLATGRSGDATLFMRADGLRWGKNFQSRPIANACQRARINPPIGFHGLRHTYASLAVMNGVPLLVVAKNLGHADTRMCEKHYAHLAESYVADAIRAGAARFGTSRESKVAVMRRKATH